MDFTGLILNDLLDKFERSAHFHGTARVNRRICFHFNQQTLPDYLTGERPGFKEALHQAVRDLEKRSLLCVEWVPGEKNNLLKKACLNLEKTGEAYALIGRVSRHAELNEISAMLEEAGQGLHTPWIAAFLANCCAAIAETASLPACLPPEKEEIGLLLAALRGLEHKGEAEMLERVFSIKYLGGSKLFNHKVKSGLVAAARSCCFKDLELSGEDVLNELGIVKTTEELLLAGPLSAAIKGRTVDLAPLAFGTVIDTQAGGALQIAGLKASQVLLVENKTNYHYLVRRGLPENLLLIYLGGFPGPQKRRFLAALHDFCRENALPVDFLHWGDIDWGGIRIHQLLKEQALPALQPLYMDRETLLAYRGMAESFGPSYRARLLKLRHSPRYAAFHDLIGLMLELNLRLEQEALLAAGNFTLHPAL
ncbi:MAG: Wadjet anti-phage system protein JetD domain-containing protein [Bacillota bacterium]